MKCKNCNKEIIDASKIVAYLGDTYCSFPCFKMDAEKLSQTNVYRELCSYICHIFAIPRPDAKILSQINKLHSDGLSYKNIMAVLHYMYDIKQIKINSPTLYYVSFYIEEAKNYYLALQAKEQKAEEIINQLKNNKPVNPAIIKPNYNKPSIRQTKMRISPESVL